MIDTEKKQFQAMMNVVMETYSKPKASRELLVVWWSKLSRFEFDAVRHALDSWIDSQRYIPTPADIIEGCRGYQKPIMQVIGNLADSKPLLTHDEQKEQSDRMMKAVASVGKRKNDFKAWARKILANPQNYKHEISARFATEALNAKH